MKRRIFVLSGLVMIALTLFAAGPPCVEITADDLLNTTNPQAPNFYMSGVTEGTTTPFDDFLLAQFFSSAIGTFDLGTGNNTNYATCDQCILVHEDVDAGSNPKTVFFQESGSITVSDGNPTAGTGSGSIINVTLVEVIVDPIDYSSTPVVDGRCLFLKVLVFKPRESETSDEDTGSDDDMAVADEMPDADSEISDDVTTDSDETEGVDVDRDFVDEAVLSDSDTTEDTDKKMASDGCSITIL